MHYWGWSKDPGPTIRCGCPTPFLMEFYMKELSIFIDESGDFGEYNKISPYYIVTMVFHDQDNDIAGCLDSLEQELIYLGYPNHDAVS